VQAITVSPDQKNFFATEWGYVYQVATKDMIDFAYAKKDTLLPVHEYKDLHLDKISCMCIDGVNKYLFTADKFGGVIQTDINSKEKTHEYIRAHPSLIMAIKSTNDGRFIYSTCKDGHMKKLDIETKDYSYDFGRIHEGYISGLCCTPDNKHVLTSGKLGF